MDTTKRIAEKDIQNWFFKSKVLVVTGARQVGKTTMLQKILSDKEQVLWLNADETATRERLQEHNLSALKGVVGNYKIIVIDEIQRIKNPGLLLKLLVDNFKDIQVLATGSSALDISETVFEPLTGRHLLFHLYPFSLAEIYTSKSSFEIEQQLPFHLIYGSYPEICNQRADAEKLLKNLAAQYLYKDVLVWKDIRKPELLDKLLKLLSYQVCSEVSVHELSNQLRVRSETVETYIDLLEKSFVIYRLPAYSTNGRKEVTKMHKILFWDNGIRNAVIDNFDDLQLRNDQGQLWENFMIGERMKMNAWLNSDKKSFFWRNYNQSEVDYLETKKGEIKAFEMKWNFNKNQKVSRAFTNAYPNAATDVIHPRNFVEFCRINS
ncbi:MAG: ATP-binding protein [Chitinophagales bacterium]